MRSSCEPSSTTAPPEKTQILSARRIVDRRCAMMSVVRLCVSRTWSKAACTTFSDLESSADVASSRRTSLGLRRKTRAMATRCLWPPERRPPRSPTRVA
mmetsp:Transcript_28883/g.99718  ORF Transcript_28883/g.99718 Transcript_28883/m.99718 type:complete len:99 (-) Transcript_28883:2053-2349(-)